MQALRFLDSFPFLLLPLKVGKPNPNIPPWPDPARRDRAWNLIIHAQDLTFMRLQVDFHATFSGLQFDPFIRLQVDFYNDYKLHAMTTNNYNLFIHYKNDN